MALPDKTPQHWKARGKKAQKETKEFKAVVQRIRYCLKRNYYDEKKWVHRKAFVVSVMAFYDEHSYMSEKQFTWLRRKMIPTRAVSRKRAKREARLKAKGDHGCAILIVGNKAYDMTRDPYAAREFNNHVIDIAFKHHGTDPWSAEEF